MQFIQSQSDLWNLSPADAGTIEVVSVSQPKDQPDAAGGKPAGGTRARSRGRSESPFNLGNLKTVNLVQRVEGKEVFNSDVTAAVNANNEVISVAGQFFPGASDTATTARARMASPAERVTP